MDSIDEHEEQIGGQSRQEVGHHSVCCVVHPVVYLLQALQDRWF